jgi:DNA-binding MarR family transcriptional regulator
MGMPSIASRPLGMFGLIRAASSVQDYIEERLATVGLSIPRLAALQRLADAGDALPLGQLAERLACVKSNVTQLIDRLEADGLVKREPDPNDKRSRLAVLTDAGRRAWREGARVQNEVDAQLFSNLSVDDTVRLSEILDTIRRASSPSQ